MSTDAAPRPAAEHPVPPSYSPGLEGVVAFRTEIAEPDSAHVLEQRVTGRLVRPSAQYVGPGPRSVADVGGLAPGT